MIGSRLVLRPVIAISPGAIGAAGPMDYASLTIEASAHDPTIFEELASNSLYQGWTGAVP
jgi:hypothetical protein